MLVKAPFLLPGLEDLRFLETHTGVFQARLGRTALGVGSRFQGLRV